MGVQKFWNEIMLCCPSGSLNSKISLKCKVPLMFTSSKNNIIKAMSGNLAQFEAWVGYPSTFFKSAKFCLEV
jgi:hypothetical protein